MTTLANRIQYLAESETLAMSRKCRELRAGGKDVINLSLGNPISTPPLISRMPRRKQ